MTDTDDGPDAEEVAPTAEQLQALMTAAAALPPNGHRLSIFQNTFSLDAFAGHLAALAALGEVQREASDHTLRAHLDVGDVRYSITYLGQVDTVEETVTRKRAVWPDEVPA